MNKTWGFDNFVVTAAFRYCLGRRTYASMICADWLIEQWPNFDKKTKDLIRRELDTEFVRDDAARERGAEYKPLGHDCDRAEWERVRGLWT